VESAKSLESFKTQLDKFESTQDIVYDNETPFRINIHRTGTSDLTLRLRK